MSNFNCNKSEIGASWLYLKPRLYTDATPEEPGGESEKWYVPNEKGS